MHMRPNKTGQVAKFHTPLPGENPNQLYVVLEIKEDEIIDGDTYFSSLTYDEIIDNANILYNVIAFLHLTHLNYLLQLRYTTW